MGTLTGFIYVNAVLGTLTGFTYVNAVSMIYMVTGFTYNKYTDVSINIGREPNNKIFFAHAVVLCARSTYFEKTMVENTEEFQRTVMTFEDVTPKVFEILLR